MSAAARSRWKTAIEGSLGSVLVVWSIPLAIIAVGLPVALLVWVARMIGGMIWR